MMRSKSISDKYAAWYMKHKDEGMIARGSTPEELIALHIVRRYPTGNYVKRRYESERVEEDGERWVAEGGERILPVIATPKSKASKKKKKVKEKPVKKEDVKNRFDVIEV